MALHTTTAQPTLRAEPAPSQVSPEQGLLDQLHQLDRELSALNAEQAAFFRKHFMFHRSVGPAGRVMVLANDLREAKSIHAEFDAFGLKRTRIQRQRSRILNELAIQKFPLLQQELR